MLWDNIEALGKLNCQKFEENTEYIIRYSEPWYDDVLIHSAIYTRGQLVPNGVQLYVSYIEPNDYYYYEKHPNILSELHYMRLMNIYRTRGYYIMGYEYMCGSKLVRSVAPHIYSNHIKYYIDGTFVGNYYSAKYQKLLVRINNSISLDLPRTPLPELVLCQQLEKPLLDMLTYNHLG
jgi:hypothetical protein